LKQGNHKEVDTACKKNDGAGGLLSQALVYQVSYGKGDGINKGPGIYAETADKGNFKTGNIGQDLCGDVDGDNDDACSGQIPLKAFSICVHGIRFIASQFHGLFLSHHGM
jgi:hypothetical protein